MELTEEELKQIKIKQREQNIQTFNGCIEDSWKIIRDNTEMEEKEIDIAVTFFRVRSLTLYSLIQNALDSKIRLERERFEKEKKELMEEKIKHE